MNKYGERGGHFEKLSFTLLKGLVSALFFWFHNFFLMRANIIGVRGGEWGDVTFTP